MKKILLIALLLCAPAARAAMPGCTTGGAPLYLQIPNYGASGTQFAAAVAYDMKYISTASLTLPLMSLSTPTISAASVLKWLNVGSSVTAAGGFYGSGAGLTALPAAQLTGAVPAAAVNLSTVTTAIAGKLSNTATVPAALVDLSTVTTALAGKLSNTAAVPAGLIDLSTVTAAMSLYVSQSGSVMNGDLNDFGYTIYASKFVAMSDGFTSESGPLYLKGYDGTVKIYNGGTNTLDIWNASNAAIRLNTASTGSYIDTGYNVGIGTRSPTTKLEVIGNVKADYFVGNGSLLTGISAGSATSTMTFTLRGGADVFTASTTFAPVAGAVETIDQSTITITGVKCFTIVGSTVSATTFNIARSTDTTATTVSTPKYSYLFNTPISVSAGSNYSQWVVPDNNATYSTLPYSLALHIISSPATGAMPAEYGCIVRFWRNN